MLSEEDTVVLTSVTDAVNNVVEANRSTKVDEMHLELYGVVHAWVHRGGLDCCFLSSSGQQGSGYNLCGDESLSPGVVA
jgi:hypothetical protein